MDRKFEIIQQLMDELQDMMGHSEDDLSSRLGREKPQVAKIEVASTDEPDMGEMGEGGMDEGDMMDDPGEKLKQRLMKLRG